MVVPITSSASRLKPSSQRSSSPLAQPANAAAISRCISGRYAASASRVKADMTNAFRSRCSSPSRTGRARPPNSTWMCGSIPPSRWILLSSMNWPAASGPTMIAVGRPRIFVFQTGPIRSVRPSTNPKPSFRKSVTSPR